MNSINLAWLIRRHAVEMTHLSGGSHIGSILSVADIIAVLYSDILSYDPQDTKASNRDRFILSKGHAGGAVYAALAECGFFSTKELSTYYANGSRLSGHVSHKVPGIEVSTGSLGHGLSLAVGMAYAAKKDGQAHRIYAVIGDGECNEGSIWEAALFASKQQLGNLTVVLDYNRMQGLGWTEDILGLEPLIDKWRAFGWHVAVIDGHEHQQLKRALAKNLDTGLKPRVIIANTIKGKGVSFMQNDLLWHYRFPHSGWEYDQAVSELHSNKPEGVVDIYTPSGVGSLG